MKFYTVHLRPGGAPVLVEDRFSCAAALFGPLWLAAHGAWVPAGIALLPYVAVVALGPGIGCLLWLATAWLLGLFGQDLRRWSLETRGHTLVHVLAARDAEAAYARLLAARPDLVAAAASAA
ncbi:MAG: DUF2628 domain-containing protein [Alphaproteobacteria bacterium]|nr:DUF2628 domain-containing protein [Alphaproteobacteria bacterium]